MYIEELRDIVVARIRIFLARRSPDDIMAADSCWMSARSSATVCGWKVSDVGSTVWGDRANLAGSDAFDEGCDTTQTGSN